MDNNTNYDKMPIEVLSMQSVDLGISIGLSQPVESYEMIRKAFALDDNLPKRLNKKTDYKFNPDNEEILESCPICHTAADKATPFFNSFSFRMSNFGNPFSPAKLWMKCGCCGNMFTYSWAKSFLHPEIREQKVLLPRDEQKYIPCEHSAGALNIQNDILIRTQNVTSGKKLLEVGIGNGDLAAVALELEYDVTLVEIDEATGQTVADLLEIPVVCTDFLQYHTDEKFDVIIMGDVIEHVTDPHAAMEKANSLLADGGVIWLSTPNFESSFTRLKKFHDGMYCEPTHITWFNKKGLETLLDDCGLKMIDYKVSNRYNGSMELLIIKK
jgi:2-polyprenyl-3-methyl-5-hydroxy-6-metoxy-1,4-benzoquinol methylase